MLSRWSWSADEIHAYESSQEYRDLLAEIAAVRARFEAANPGYSLYANTTARSLDLQLQRWNSNASVGVIAERLQEAAVRELSAKSYPAHPDARATLRFASFLREWRPVPGAAPLAAPGLSLHGRSRAIDFQIMQNGRIIAPTEVAKVRSVWERQGWAGKLAAAMRDTRFVGPLQSPNEPWHYEYAPNARRARREGVTTMTNRILIACVCAALLALSGCATQSSAVRVDKGRHRSREVPHVRLASRFRRCRFVHASSACAQRR